MAGQPCRLLRVGGVGGEVEVEGGGDGEAGVVEFAGFPAGLFRGSECLQGGGDEFGALSVEGGEFVVDRIDLVQGGREIA